MDLWSVFFHLLFKLIMTGDHGRLDVEYLQKENRKLRLELKETTEMCLMHRDAVLSLTEK